MADERLREIREAESRRLWRLAGMGGTLASEILAGALIGWLLDALFKTKPILLIVMTIAGVIVGMATFIRGAVRESQAAGRAASRIAHEQDLEVIADAEDNEDDEDDRP